MLPSGMQLSITLSHTCASRPSHCLAFHRSPVSPVLCLYRCESLCFLCCLCPALRIHNHTVLPSSHNSSYVYTNDSAYTNISATVGEDPSLFFLTEIHSCITHCSLLSSLYLHTVELSVSHSSPCSVLCPCLTR